MTLATSESTFIEADLFLKVGIISEFFRISLLSYVFSSQKAGFCYFGLPLCFRIDPVSLFEAESYPSKCLAED